MQKNDDGTFEVNEYQPRGINFLALMHAINLLLKPSQMRKLYFVVPRGSVQDVQFQVRISADVRSILLR